MGLSISHKETKGDAVRKFQVTERLFLTADKSRVVSESDPDAAFLYSTPGKDVPYDEAVAFGLVEAAPVDEPEVVAPKRRRPPANKERTPEGDK